MGLGWLVPLVILGLLVWGGIVFSRSGGCPQRDSMSGDSEKALAIFKERYARGKLDREIYEAVKPDLK